MKNKLGEIKTSCAEKLNAGKISKYSALLFFAVSFAILCSSVKFFALPWYVERENFAQEEELLAQENAALQSFAAQFTDYAAHKKKQENRLAALRAKLPQKINLAEEVKKLQQAAEQGAITLREIKMHAENPAQINAEAKANESVAQNKISSQGIEICAAGDYFAMLCWLRQLERKNAAVQNLRMNGDSASGVVELRAEIIFYALK